MQQSEVNNRRLDKFQGKSSISSEDYFGDGKPKSSQSSMLSGPDIGMMKQDLKEGVTKMAGKLSNMATYAMSSLQVQKNKHSSIIKKIKLY